MSIADTLKNHIVVVVSSVAIGSFGAGWAAYKAIAEAQGQVLVLKTKHDELVRSAEELSKCQGTSTVESPIGLESCRKRLAEEISSQYVRKADVERDYVPRSQTRFVGGQWRYLAMPKATGVDVARRLTEISPPRNSVVVSYDGSQNVFHVWYRGQGTSTRYTYDVGTGADLTDPPRTNFFLSEEGVVPAGIGGIGGTAVPIFFVATGNPQAPGPR
jgi:hypothetical protein